MPVLCLLIFICSYSREINCKLQYWKAGALHDCADSACLTVNPGEAFRTVRARHASLAQCLMSGCSYICVCSAVVKGTWTSPLGSVELTCSCSPGAHQEEFNDFLVSVCPEAYPLCITTASSGGGTNKKRKRTKEKQNLLSPAHKRPPGTTTRRSCQC